MGAGLEGRGEERGGQVLGEERGERSREIILVEGRREKLRGEREIAEGRGGEKREVGRTEMGERRRGGEEGGGRGVEWRGGGSRVERRGQEIK